MKTMSTSLLYHAFSLRGCNYVRTRFEKGKTIFVAKIRRKIWRCAVCNSRKLRSRGSHFRRLRSVPIGKKAVEIELDIPRVDCLYCRLVRQIKLDFVETRKSYTRAFERLALDLSRHMTIQAVAHFLGVSWHVVKEIQKCSLKRRFSKIRLKDVRRIGIDEISIGKHHRYLTVVLDLDTGAIIFVAEGKGASSLDSFFRRIRRSKATIEAVAMDMSKAYIAAVTEHLPKASIVFDHFHVIKLYNETLTKLRRSLYYKEKTKEGRSVLKGTRWLLLKNPENLDEAKNEQARLQEALEVNKPLAMAYYLKEELSRLWSCKTKEIARKALNHWIYTGLSSGIRHVISFSKTLFRHFDGILAFYDHSISNGPLEGTNNKIKTMQRQAYGFRDQEFFMLKIYGLHETKYELVG